jgi:hypothetical protein
LAEAAGFFMSLAGFFMSLAGFLTGPAGFFMSLAGFLTEPAGFLARHLATVNAAEAISKREGAIF